MPGHTPPTCSRSRTVAAQPTSNLGVVVGGHTLKITECDGLLCEYKGLDGSFYWSGYNLRGARYSTLAVDPGSLLSLELERSSRLPASRGFRSLRLVSDVVAIDV